jgi:hypothetical protein
VSGGMVSCEVVARIGVFVSVFVSQRMTGSSADIIIVVF